ncbi:uncharacterized protein [Bemisia tabaci]|uniref:uncharacterized protein isoform X2 n=1 Tax=Bemisia tabaci TaxID=7038 RepID=UPI003B27FD77
MTLKMDTRPGSQLKSELIFGDFAEDLWLRTNFRNKKENDQPIVNPVNVDIKTAGDDSYHLDNMHQRPILPLAKPYVKVDGPEESNSDEQKYVTSSLLLKIKAEEAEDDKTQLAGRSNDNVVLQLVSKPEPNIESSDGIMTFGLPNFKSEIKLSEELILDDFEGDSEGSHRETSYGDFHDRLNPVVVLERFDLHLAGSRSNPSEAKPSSQFLNAFLQMDFGSCHACHHDEVKDNPEIYNLPVNHQKSPGHKSQHFPESKSRGKIVSNKDEKLPHHISANSVQVEDHFGSRKKFLSSKTASDHAYNGDQAFARGSNSTDIVELQTEYQSLSKDRPSSNDNLFGGLKSRAISERHKTEIEISNRISSFDQCVKEFKSKAQLRSQVVHVQSIDQPYACGQCSRKFKQKDNLKKHLLVVHSDDGPFSCGKCSKKFKTKNSLRKHLNQVQCDDRPFSCSHCAGKFKSKGDLKSHVGCAVSINRPYSCNQCSGKFKTKGHLQSHVVTVHSADRPYSCRQCSGNFKTKYSLKQHVTLVHCDDRPYSCCQCSRKFKRKADLKKHMFVHSDDRPLSCGHCSRNFKMEGSLKVHVTRVHCDGRPYSCGQCSGNYKTKSSLKQHVTHVHGDDRPYSCCQCSRKFKRKDDLKKHMFVHSDDRPFSCGHCSRNFKTEGSLKEHVTRYHCDGRPYSCGQCSGNYKTKRSLKQHVTRVHCDDRTYSCCQCLRTFKRKASLERHMFDHSDNRP